MRLCPICDQPVAEEITNCPNCGDEIGDGRKYIDDYRIVDVLHEGHASFLCRAIRERTNEHVMIRLFSPQSGVDQEVASRLMREIEKLKKLPDEGFVKHYAIRRSSDKLWYRISEWLETESWGSLLASGDLSDRRVLFDLFRQMASILAALHREGYFIPHLILNDIIIVRDGSRRLEVKIDYKLSRFFDPKTDQPGPMLKHLMNCHPDIIHDRPLDFRSDIWSLGKIFVELLTADLEGIDLLAKIDDLELPESAAVLLKVMLADDPEIRPRSMAEVAESLERVSTKALRKTKVQAADTSLPSAKRIRRQPKKLILAAAGGMLISLFAILAWFQFSPSPNATEALETYANMYAPSVAFVLVDYWLESDGVEYYRNLAEGTAFLVDRAGYMLTSRHVVCPWLEDNALRTNVRKLVRTDITPQFGYRLYLWFEGQKAFNQTARMMEASELTDVYLLKSAFSNESEPRVFIAGVPKSPVRTREVMAAPLKDDFAVLKIDQVPEGLIPLPLDQNMDSQKIPKLSRLITLGFPLGNRTQTDFINVSVTSGHVRRAFENMLQVDASLYRGNSGGPAINTRGQVIGIVSGVAMDWSENLDPVATPRWDIGMVLPITKSVEFLHELKAGRMKWNGEPDFLAEAMIAKVRAKALEGRWADAQLLADRELQRSRHPALLMGAGMMHFCARDYTGARRLFAESLSMDAANNEAKLMMYLIDWLSDPKAERSFRKELLSLDWRSPAEFQGYLVKVLERKVKESSALDGWYSTSERIWLNYAVGLIRSRQTDWPGAEKRLREAVQLGETDGWEFFLARSALEEIQKRRRQNLDSEELLKKYETEVEAFDRETGQILSQKRARREKVSRIEGQMMSPGGSIKEKVTALERIHDMDPENRRLLVGLAFYSAANEDWPRALSYIHNFVQGGGRPYAGRMNLQLLAAGILNYQGQKLAAQSDLENFLRHTRDPWYQTICEYLLGKQNEEALKRHVGENPENLITVATALGFWSEGAGETEKAIRYYNDALGTFLDTWRGYDFAKERLKKLKTSSE